MGLPHSLGVFFFIVFPLLFGYGSYAENTKEGDSGGGYLGYNALYNSKKHVHPHPDNSAKETGSPYLTGYRHVEKESMRGQYRVQYGGKNPFKSSYRRYRGDEKETDKNNHQSEKSYLTGYHGDDQKETDKNNHQSEKSYLTGYHGVDQKETDKNNHQSEKFYLTGYRGDEKETDTNNHQLEKSYLTGYRGDEKETDKNNHQSEKSYLTGYRQGDDANEDIRKPKPYITQYGDKNNHFKSSYLRYRGDEKETEKNNHLSEKSYLTGYHQGDDAKEDLRKPKPYITQYGDKNNHFKSSYLKYRGDEKVTDKNNHQSEKSYLTGHREDEKERGEKKHGSDLTSYDDVKEDIRKPKPYITQYGDKNKHFKRSYLTGYHGDEKENNKNNHQSDKSYLTGYHHNEKENGKNIHDDSYLASYGADAKEDTRETKPYIVQYGDKADHAEAFKDGFFSLDDLYVGNKMGLKFPVENFSNFIPRKVAESIPFSSSQLQSVFQLFSISPDSLEARGMQDVHEQCEAEPLTGETKTCVTSLESMTEFVQSILGSSSNYELLTTSYPKMSSTSSLQNFTIMEISKDLPNGPEWVACHPFPYPYVVYYCHYISTGTRIFKVSLAGENGERMEALGVCHLDTSEWSAGHVVFKQLGFKPGDAPICHFFPIKHLMWVPAVPTKAAS